VSLLKLEVVNANSMVNILVLFSYLMTLINVISSYVTRKPVILAYVNRVLIFIIDIRKYAGLATCNSITKVLV
jgi:hypothetical protein